MPERPKRATLRELAEQTGLSPAAVSYAMRGLQVSPETEERVRAAAADIGYEADPIARALRTGATGMVGVLVGSLADFWSQELVRAIQRELRSQQRHTVVADADGMPELELELARRLVDQRVDGLIAVPIGPASDGWESVAKAVPLVTIGDALEGVATVAEVVFDNRRGVAQTLEHLQSLGHRQVAVLSWAVETSPGRPAERAVVETAAALGLDCRIVPCAYSLNGSLPLAVELLTEPDHPTAIFCLSDSIAYGVYMARQTLGLRIPEDVSVAGFDDHPISRLLSPPLTSTSWGVEAIAAMSTRLLTDALDGVEPGAVETVAPRLMIRASTAAPSAR